MQVNALSRALQPGGRGPGETVARRGAEGTPDARTRGASGEGGGGVQGHIRATQQPPTREGVWGNRWPRASAQGTATTVWNRAVPICTAQPHLTVKERGDGVACFLFIKRNWIQLRTHPRMCIPSPTSCSESVRTSRVL